MKRVLFVDDEPEALAALERMIEPQELPWETAFAPSGVKALDLLSQSPFDVIISDVRMPEMDGAALLKAVCERFPAVVRIVVCSQEEMNAALRSVPVAHQFLLKPCDPHMLRVAIERATSLSDVLSNKLLASIIGSVKDLPVLPRTFMALREKLADPDASVKEVVKLVEQDVSISAKILQLVNSAFFGLPREISTLNTAVSYLGIDMLQNLVLSAEVFRVFENAAKLPGFSFEEVHQHSQLTAKIASHIPVPAAIHSAAIVAGLLHDVGKLVLATRSPKHFARAVAGAAEEKRPLFAVEQELMGASHAEVGAYLLGIWGLPCPVIEAVAHHHHPERIPLDTLDAVAVVHIANYLAHENPVHPASDDLSYSYLKPDAAYLEDLGLTEQLPGWNEFAVAAAAEMREGPKRQSNQPLATARK
ncbi:MAG TPA: response regulator [Candidatus Acidoferrum sp.]|nr:response regulator [Candidatus Acidoferrum sp.]